jgi:hypothetical protein
MNMIFYAIDLINKTFFGIDKSNEVIEQLVSIIFDQGFPPGFRTKDKVVTNLRVGGHICFLGINAKLMRLLLNRWKFDPFRVVEHWTSFLANEV